MQHHIILTGICFGAQATQLVLPTFEPNEYFFKHHQREGEEEWECYARVIRQIIAKYSGLKLSDKTVFDKFEYKKSFGLKVKSSD